MSASDTFTRDEWAQLRELPFKVILGAIASDAKGPLGAAAKETVAAARRLVADAQQKPNNALIAELLAAFLEDDGAADPEFPLSDAEIRMSVMDDAIASAQAVSLILAERIDATTAEEFCNWIFAAAEAAVTATRSGGLLGIGSELISASESAYVARLADALALREHPASE